MSTIIKTKTNRIEVEIINPSRALKAAMVLRGYVCARTEWVKTCHSDTCCHASHDSGYALETWAVSPAFAAGLYKSGDDVHGFGCTGHIISAPDGDRVKIRRRLRACKPKWWHDAKRRQALASESDMPLEWRLGRFKMVRRYEADRVRLRAEAEALSAEIERRNRVAVYNWEVIL